MPSRFPPYWVFASLMLRRKGRAALAVLFAFISAAGLGVGLVALLPVLRIILQDNPVGLRQLAPEWNAKVAKYGLELSRSTIDRLPADPFESVVWIVVLLGLLTVVGGIANFVHAYLTMTISVEAVGEVRRRAFHRLLHVPLGVVVSGRSADLISRVVSDSNMLVRGFTAMTSKAMANVTKGIAALGAAFFINWRLTLISAVAMLPLFFVIKTVGKRIRRASRGAMRGQAEMLGAATETMGGFRVVKVYGAERFEIGRFSRVNRMLMRQQMRARAARALSGPIMETISIIVLGGLSIVAVKAIFDGNLDREEFILTLGSLAAAANALKPINSIVQQIHQAEAAADRLAEVLALPMEDDQLERRKPALPRLAESIEFENIGFRYEGAQDPALASINLRIEAGQTVAFVGPNGSGKTTLLSLVPRLFSPTRGRVLIDGRDIADYSVRSLRAQVGVVTQEVVLFRGTVAENIAYGSPGATRASITDAAERASAAGFIADMPGAYDGMIGDQGLTLSGGQRQRIAIARAILRDPAILILDEATSMIDSESEARITEAIARFARGRTCLVVAHRLSTVINADRIVVMDAGRIVDDGTHAELSERCEIYRQLVKHQLAPAAV